MATLMRAIARHRRRREFNLSVDTSCKAHGMLDPCAYSNHTHRAWHACWAMPDPLSVLCMSIDFVSCTVTWGFMLSHILISVMCLQLLHVLHMHSLRLAPQCPAFHYMLIITVWCYTPSRGKISVQKDLRRLWLCHLNCCPALAQKYNNGAETHLGGGVMSTIFFPWVTVAYFNCHWQLIMCALVGRAISWPPKNIWEWR